MLVCISNAVYLQFWFMAEKGFGTSIFYFLIICLHWSADLVSWTQLFRDQDEKMPTGYDKKRGTAKSKKEMECRFYCTFPDKHSS